jgi:AcrR family transcriptional regulator
MPDPLPGVVRLRDQQEALTRQTILTAARALFAEHGYAATPVRLLAKRAGVSPQTIYSTYGSKAGVLAGLPDLLDQEAGVTDLFDSRHDTADPAELLRLLARISRRIREHCGDIMGILRSGAAVDADIAATMAEGFRRQRLGVEAVLEQALGDRATARTADVATALMSHDVYDTLVESSHWTFDEYETWLGDSLIRLLL